MSFDVPVLLITWRRLDTTIKLIEAVRKVKPKIIYVSSDGPREGNIPEQLAVENVRKMIIQEIDWKCDVKKKFSNINQGCRIGVSSAISWFFENEPFGIILEDDVIPLPEFFDYCKKYLHKYEENLNIFV